jgi:biopolymer transport protein ExbD
MAEIDTSGGGKQKGGVKKSKKMSTRVDMTPMVDLGFLLITFFMLTTSFAKPQVMNLAMPDKEVKKEDLAEVKEGTVITLLLAKENAVVYYEGIPTTELNTTTINYKELRDVLLSKKKKVDAEYGMDDNIDKVTGEKKAPKSKALVLIKPSDDATYNNLVDAIDECQIAGITRYAILDLAPVEKAMLNSSVAQ